MKKNDIALILVVGFVSAVFALILSNVFISSADNRQEEVEVVGEIVADFPEPDKEFFHEKSLNPTLVIEISPNDTEKPFKDPDN